MDSKPSTRIDNSLHGCVLFSNYGDLWDAIFVANNLFINNFINLLELIYIKVLKNNQFDGSTFINKCANNVILRCCPIK